jgi:uncharacterized membrane protein YqjE
MSTGELVRQTLEETKELVRIELKLARDELGEDLVQLKSVAILAGVALVLAILTLSTLVVALVLALGGTAIAALLVAAVLLVGAGVTAAVAYKYVPKEPLQRTRARLKNDINHLKEHVI